MSDLSPQAADALRQLRRGMQPHNGDQARAWVRLGRRIAEAEHRPYVEPLWTRFRRRLLPMLPRLVVPALLIAAVMFAISPFLGPEVSGRADLSLAKDLIEQRQFGRAYQVLVDHSRRFRTVSAAEGRMGLVLDALCGLNRTKRAEAELERYLEMKPDSVHADRRRDVCAAPPPR